MSKAHKRAYQKGWEAASEGAPASDNPYWRPKAAGFRHQWVLGWSSYWSCLRITYIQCDTCGNESMTLDVVHRGGGAVDVYLCERCGYQVDAYK